MFLDRLNSLMAERHINRHVLSKETGIPYTTIDAFYKRGYENIKLSTLRKLCRYFNVTLDYLVDWEDQPHWEMSLSPAERSLIQSYRLLEQEEKQAIGDRISQLNSRRKVIDLLLGKEGNGKGGYAIAHGGDAIQANLSPEERRQILDYFNHTNLS